MIFRLVFFIVFFLLLDYYLFSSITPFFNKSSFLNRIFNYIYWIISLIIYFIIIYVVLNFERRTPSVHFNNEILISSFMFIVFISKFFALFPLIIDDFLRFIRIIINLFTDSSSDKPFYSVSRLNFLRNTSIVIASSFFFTMLGGIIFGRYNFKLKHTDIKLNKFGTSFLGLKIIHISDLHLGSFNSIEKLNNVVDLINSENPEIVVFTGDLVNNYYNEAVPYIDTLKKIKSKYGNFSVLGNHDYCDYVGWKRSSEKWKTNFNNMIEIHEKMGFKLLLNDSIIVNAGNSKINLVGVENWGAGNFNKDGDLSKAMLDVDNSIPTILLSHDPSHWTAEVLDFPKRIDLQLAGHTHGMQFGIDIPGIKWSPVQWRYKQWSGLYKDKSNKYIYVNTGVGNLAYAGRVGIMPEISVLNLS